MMPELFFLPADALAHPPELSQLPLWLQLGFAGAVVLATALGFTLS
jgi:hypothetical protein